MRLDTSARMRFYRSFMIRPREPLAFFLAMLSVSLTIALDVDTPSLAMATRRWHILISPPLPMRRHAAGTF